MVQRVIAYFQIRVIQRLIHCQSSGRRETVDTAISISQNLPLESQCSSRQRLAHEVESVWFRFWAHDAKVTSSRKWKVSLDPIVSGCSDQTRSAEGDGPDNLYGDGKHLVCRHQGSLLTLICRM